MSSGISHRKDVEFLESCNPPLVERNADEFKRLHDMLVAVDPSAERAEKHTQWKSEAVSTTRPDSPRGANSSRNWPRATTRPPAPCAATHSRWRSPRPTTPTARRTSRPSRH